MNKPVFALLLATLTCGTASAYLWRELRVERAQTDELKARIVQLERGAPAAPAIETAAPKIAATVGPTVETTTAGASAALKPVTPPATFGIISQTGNAAMASAGARGPTDPEMRRRMQESFDQQRKMLQDPEYRELMRSQHKMGMKRMYGDMEIMLGVSKEEADRILDVLAEQQLRSMEQRQFAAPWDGTPPDEATMREQQRAFEETKRRNDAELAKVLGSRHGEWQEYQNSMWSRSQVMRLRETLAASDEPLRQDQIKPLVQALANEQQHMQMNSMRGQVVQSGGQVTHDAQLRMQEEWLERTAQSHERIRNSVSSLLSPAQLQQLQEQQEQERKMQELNLRMQRARAAEAAARGEDPATGGFVGLATPVIR